MRSQDGGAGKVRPARSSKTGSMNIPRTAFAGPASSRCTT